MTIFIDMGYSLPDTEGGLRGAMEPKIKILLEVQGASKNI